MLSVTFKCFSKNCIYLPAYLERKIKTMWKMITGVEVKATRYSLLILPTFLHQKNVKCRIHCPWCRMLHLA